MKIFNQNDIKASAENKQKRNKKKPIFKDCNQRWEKGKKEAFSVISLWYVPFSPFPVYGWPTTKTWKAIFVSQDTNPINPKLLNISGIVSLSVVCESGIRSYSSDYKSKLQNPTYLDENLPATQICCFWHQKVITKSFNAKYVR